MSIEAKKNRKLQTIRAKQARMALDNAIANTFHKLGIDANTRWLKSGSIWECENDMMVVCVIPGDIPTVVASINGTQVMNCRFKGEAKGIGLRLAWELAGLANVTPM